MLEVAAGKFALDVDAPDLRLINLRVPPSNHFEKLRGNLAGLHSIRVNQQWRLIFRWDGKRGEAADVYLDDHTDADESEAGWHATTRCSPRAHFSSSPCAHGEKQHLHGRAFRGSSESKNQRRVMIAEAATLARIYYQRG